MRTPLFVNQGENKPRIIKCPGTLLFPHLPPFQMNSLVKKTRNGVCDQKVKVIITQTLRMIKIRGRARCHAGSRPRQILVHFD